MTHHGPPDVAGLEAAAGPGILAPDLELAVPSHGHLSASALAAETDAMRAEATALGLPDTVEGLLAFALREVAGLRIAVREVRAEVEWVRTEYLAFAEDSDTQVEALSSEVTRLKLRVKKLEGEL